MRFRYPRRLLNLLSPRSRQTSDSLDNHGAIPITEDITNIQPIVFGGNEEPRRITQGIFCLPVRISVTKVHARSRVK